MRRGVNALLFTAALASAGCVTDSGKLDIRPIADPYSKATNAGNPAVAEGRGLLAAGSVGLAIEAFRKALREQPDSIEALAGLAECYDQMGRHDLSRAKYEAALAIAPNNVTLLRTFAASLERQGRYAEAISLRSEASQTERTEAVALLGMTPAAPALVAAPPPTAPIKAAPVQPRLDAAPAKVAAVQPMPAPTVVRTSSVESRPPSVPVKFTEALPKPAPAPARPAEVQPEPAPAPIKIADARVALTSAPVVRQVEWQIEAPVPVSLPAAAASVTVKLPPAAPAVAETPKVAAATPPQVEPPKVAEAAVPQVAAPPVRVASAPLVEIPNVEIAAGPSVTVKLPPARPAAIPPEKPVVAAPEVRLAEAIAPKAGPRLERLSLAEVALVTNSRPRWRTEAVRYASIAAPPRFVPIAELRGNGGLRLLNAARRQGLAASTRLVLNRQGWNGVTIGDYGRVREKSLVLYSEKTERAARKLAAKYGIWIAKEARPGPLTILLGRDWVTRRQARG